MLRRVASSVSMRSRERKLERFRALLHPGPETTVVDVGVTNAPFGAGSTDNFFDEAQVSEPMGIWFLLKMPDDDRGP